MTRPLSWKRTRAHIESRLVRHTIYYTYDDGRVNWKRTLPVWFGFLTERLLGRARAHRWHLLTGYR
jgi:hypothetical protein